MTRPRCEGCTKRLALVMHPSGMNLCRKCADVADALPSRFDPHTAWPEPCTHPNTRPVTIPASGYYDGDKRVDTPAHEAQWCPDCGRYVSEEA